MFDPDAIKHWIENIPPSSSFHSPNWVIAGSISQVDDNVISQSRGGSLSLGFGDFGVSADKISSVISLDLRLIDWNSRQLRNGSALSNSIAVMRDSASVDFGARLKSNIGTYLDVSNENNESGGQAVRSLIQLTTMQLLGNLTGVPYQSCLNLDVPPNYQALRQEVTTIQAPKLKVTINTSRGLSDPVYRLNESLDFSITVNQSADVHCFINDIKHKIRPIFPNLAHPNSQLTANQSVHISPNTAQFDYRFDETGQEQLLCVASPNNLQSPWGFNKDVINAEYLPVSDASDIESGYRQKTDGEVKLEKLTIYIDK